MGDSTLQLERINVYYNESSCEWRGATPPFPPIPGHPSLGPRHRPVGPRPCSPSPTRGAARRVGGSLWKNPPRCSGTPDSSLAPAGAGNPTSVDFKQHLVLPGGSELLKRTRCCCEISLVGHVRLLLKFILSLKFLFLNEGFWLKL